MKNDSFILNRELDGLSEPARFIAYSRSYLQTSHDLCERIINDEHSKNWPNASVTMLLAAHAVELFLKGAILSRDQSRFKTTHDLIELRGIYDSVFPEREFYLDMAFQRETEYLGFSEEEVEIRRKEKHPIPSIQHRYPVDSPGKEWPGIANLFMPEAFLETLRTVREDFNRVTQAFGDI